MPAILELAPDHPELETEDLDHLVAPKPEADETQAKDEVEKLPRKDLRERIFDQLFAFNDAVHKVKDYLSEHPQATLDELMQQIGPYGFRPNQAEHFKDGITELLRRRAMVKLARDTYRQREGDAYPAGLCEELFGFRPQSPVTIDESDPNNLMALVQKIL